jgi:hypothetical protein
MHRSLMSFMTSSSSIICDRFADRPSCRRVIKPFTDVHVAVAVGIMKTRPQNSSKAMRCGSTPSRSNNMVQALTIIGGPQR